ncbi:hypothetical protein LWI28_022754 [Acer negundo]|uniref:Bifunctional inhibitor/plant lipid transfer protein/seed storage helical domain-containing protein n=1 Tax=Acer negundo TaxID=4023 RepID=A0AAD5IGT0_ACENE|nr:hypothetical protein LWI28_022754 [Acer negundo]KAK4840057.1 hypothetical protein QYF36_026967 [Acer negundo]
MAGLKSQVSLKSNAALLVLIIAVAMCAALQAQIASAQSCTAELNNLNVCAPFVVPGLSENNPTAECCTALQSVEHDCLCNTVRIAARLPVHCNLPPLTCGN